MARADAVGRDPGTRFACKCPRTGGLLPALRQEGGVLGAERRRQDDGPHRSRRYATQRPGDLRTAFPGRAPGKSAPTTDSLVPAQFFAKRFEVFGEPLPGIGVFVAFAEFG